MERPESPLGALELFLPEGTPATRRGADLALPAPWETMITGIGRTLGGLLGNPKVRLALAGDTHSPPALLGWLAHDERDEMKLALARNPVAPAEVLFALARWNSVRPALAYNPGAPATLLATLKDHWDPWVRRAVARNPKTPAEILCKLSRDRNLWVRHAVAGNPRTPRAALRQLANEDEVCLNRALTSNPYARSAIALEPA